MAFLAGNAVNAVIGDKDEPLYREFVGFRDRAVRDKFAAAVLEAIRPDHPEIFDDSP